MNVPCVICCCFTSQACILVTSSCLLFPESIMLLISAFCTCSFLCLGWHSFLVLTGISSLLVKFVSIVTSSGQVSLVSDILAAAAAKSLRSCPTLCDPIDRSPRGSPVPGILQARTLEWVESEVAQSCPTFRDTMDCSLPGSSVHGIFQARVLEWGVIAFSF